MTVEQANSPKTMRRAAILVLRWLVPLTIITLFVVSGHLGSAISALVDVRPIWASVLVLVGIALPLSHAWRWRLLLRRAGGEISNAAATRVTALASLVNYAAPGFLGAPAKAVFAREGNGVPISRSLPTLAVEQALDALMLVLAGTVAVLIAGPSMLGSLGGIDTNSEWMLAGMILLAIVLIVPVIIGAVMRFAPSFATALRDATASLAYSRNYRGEILGLTALRWILDMLAVGIASLAVGLRLGVIDILLVANIALLAGLVAPVPGGLGVREAAMAAIAGVIGVSIPLILALSVLHRAGLAIGLPLVLAGARIYQWGRP